MGEEQRETFIKSLKPGLKPTAVELHMDASVCVDQMPKMQYCVSVRSGSRCS